MEINNIKLRLEEGVDLPCYKTEEAAGFDLSCNKIIAAYKGDKKVPEDKLKAMNDGFKKRKYIKLRAFERLLFGTGIFVEIPKGKEIQIRSRSGTTLKKGLTVLNSPGTIDSDYRGEIGIILYNSSPFLTEVEFGERIAQGIVAIASQAVLEETDVLSSTERGEGGFGSTGTS